MYNLRIAAIYQLFLKNCLSLWTNQSAGSESPANQRAREPVSVFTHAQGVLWPSFHHRIHTIRRFWGWVFRKFKNEDIGKVFCLASKIKFLMVERTSSYCSNEAIMATIPKWGKGDLFNSNIVKDTADL